MEAKISATLDLVVQISYVNDNELFKSILDYWSIFVCDIFSSECSMDALPSQFAFGGRAGNGGHKLQASRKVLHGGVLSKLRLLMICRMAKPEEIIIVEDENGNIVREAMKDNATLVQYRIMRETLVYLSHLDHDDTESQMLEKLALQVRRRFLRSPPPFPSSFSIRGETLGEQEGVSRSGQMVEKYPRVCVY